MTDKLTLAVALGAISTIALAVYAWRDLHEALDTAFAEPFGDVPHTNHVQSDTRTGAQQDV